MRLYVNECYHEDSTQFQSPGFIIPVGRLRRANPEDWRSLPHPLRSVFFGYLVTSSQPEGEMRYPATGCHSSPAPKENPISNEMGSFIQCRFQAVSCPGSTHICK